MERQDLTLIEIANHIIIRNPQIFEQIDHILYNERKKLALISDSSYGGERIILEYYVDLLEMQSGIVVDIAASDGYTQSATLGLFSRKDWSGLAVELDQEKFRRLASLYSQFPSCRLARIKITPDNIYHLLTAFGIPTNFNVLNLDIDSYDLHVMNSLLRNGYRPQIITMEINEKIPPGIFFSVNYNEHHTWKNDHFFGCSLDAAADMVKQYGYKLARLEYNNAFFINSYVAPMSIDDLNSNDAYESGYLNRPDRKTLFHWNRDVDHWTTLAPAEAVVEIERFFSQYRGLFTIKLSHSKVAQRTS